MSVALFALGAIGFAVTNGFIVCRALDGMFDDEGQRQAR